VSTTAPQADAPEVLGGRLTAVDALRGLVIILMVIDHTRDFLQDLRIDATNIATTTSALFFSRWVTHLCAPVFVFLAGASAYLALAMGKVRDHPALARYLAVRGLMLAAMELTLVRIGSRFNWHYEGMLLQVIWVIGVSLLLLAGLVACRMPARWVGCVGAVIVLGHNLLDRGLGGTTQSPVWSWMTTMLLRPGPLPVGPGVFWMVAYPLLPWFGIMALGYAFGPVLTLRQPLRLKITAGLGLALCVGFVLLRALNVYGDPGVGDGPDSWTSQRDPVKFVLAFLNCLKYPPSLLFDMMTLGLGLLLLAAFEAAERLTMRLGHVGAVRRFLITYGRVPLFFYLLHWPLIHVLAIGVIRAEGRPIPWTEWPLEYPPDVGYSLGFVYLMWALVVGIMYGPCAWFAQFRRRHRDWKWLGYL
jgi:uncharacterized membrane protein